MLSRSLPLLLGAAALASSPVSAPATSTSAADPAAGMLPPLRTFTGQDGLPENAVMGLALAGDGRLWVATQDGVGVYDGRGWRTESVPDKARSNFLRCVAPAPDGALWFGRQDGGVAGWQAGRWTDLAPTLPPGAQMVDALLWADGALWAATDHGGLGRWDGRAWRWFGAREGVPSEQTRALAAWDGALWVGTRSGVARLQDGKVVATELPGSPISALASFSDGLWAGTSDGRLWRRTAAGWTPVPEAPANLPWITALAETRDAAGRITRWIATDGAGLLAEGPEGWRRFGPGQGLPSASVWSLQPEGAPARALWIGTDGGLVRLGFGGWLQAGPGQGLADPSVYGLCVPTSPALAGTAWFGTRSALYRFQAGKAQAVPLPGGTGSFSVAEWEGALYAGDRGGGLVRSRDGRRFERVPTPPELSRANIRTFTVMADAAGHPSLWAVTGDHGLWRLDGDAWIPVPGLPPALHTTLRTSDGALWVGTERAGLVRMAPGPEGALRTFGLADGLPNLTVMSLAEIRRDGRPWLCAGTEGGGLLLAPLSPQPAWQTLSTATDPALPNDTVYQLRQDREGRLYAFTNQGVARLSFAEGGIRVETFGVGDGLPGPEFNGGASTVDAEGRIWAGNAAGVAMFDPAAELRPGPVPPLDLTAPWPEGARLGWRDRALRFTYRLETLAKADQVRYRTQLVGLEEGPTTWTPEATREFPGLAPGTYTFRVEARLPDGRVTPARERAFTLPPPPWASPWAYGAYGLAGLGLLALLVRLRLAALRRRTEELEVLVAERTAEVEGQKQHIEAQNRRIAGLLERGGLAQQDLMGWAKAIGREVADALSAEEVGLFMVQEEGLRALAESGVRAPSLEELQAGGIGRPWAGPERRQGDQPVPEDRRRQILPVRGSAGELLGGVVVKGAPPLGALERQLVDAFAAQMGAVLELHRTKQTLQAARARQAEAKASLQAKGIALLHLCPVCRRCYPDAVAHCPEDGAALELPRLLPLVLAGRYRLERLLGEGGMGLVFGARDERLGREVAVKLLKPEVYAASAVQARFQQEARMLAALAHPGIIAIFDSGELEDGHAYLVMERLHGAPLGALLERHGAGSPRQVASLLRQTAAALAAAHRAGIIHRDLKPDNVFLVPDGPAFQAKLLDFGLAKALDGASGVTRTGMVVGTPQYMSPEQVRGQTLDGRSDLYALAALAYEAISGRRLIRTEFAMEVFSAIARGQHTPLAQAVPVDAAVSDLVEAGLALDPAARPSDLEAWAARLAEALEALPPPSAQAPGWPPIPPEGFAGPRPVEGTEPTAQLPRG